MIIEGRARLLELDDINTDQIHLAMYSHLPISEQAQHCLETVAPGLAASIVPGDILIVGRNFGCGSARPAQLDLMELGLGGVIAESLDRKFFGNAVSSGFTAVSCAKISASVSEGDQLVLDSRNGTVTNRSAATVVSFPPLPDFLSDMLEVGGEFSYLAAQAGVTKESQS